MSAYTDFVKEFASRSIELFDELKGDAEAIELEVTFLIAIATSSFVMTYERMKKNNPSANYEVFPKTQEILKEEFDKSINDSCLFNGEWQYLEVQSIDGDPDTWLKEKYAICISQKNTKKMIDIIRNALAHGSIWTKGKTIDMLIFVSRKDYNQSSGPFEVLYCSPKTFKYFVKNWVGLLKKT